MSSGVQGGHSADSLRQLAAGPRLEGSGVKKEAGVVLMGPKPRGYLKGMREEEIWF